MADEKEEKPRRRAERLYDSDAMKKQRSSKEPREEREPKREAAREERGGGEAGEGRAREHAEMMKRHENERRDVHGRQRDEHREIDREEGPNMVHKKIAAHHRHRVQIDQMHERHEKELMDKMAAAAPAEAPQQQAA